MNSYYALNCDLFKKHEWYPGTIATFVLRYEL